MGRVGDWVGGWMPDVACITGGSDRDRDGNVEQWRGNS